MNTANKQHSVSECGASSCELLVRRALPAERLLMLAEKSSISLLFTFSLKKNCFCPNFVPGMFSVSSTELAAVFSKHHGSWVRSRGDGKQKAQSVLAAISRYELYGRGVAEAHTKPPDVAVVSWADTERLRIVRVTGLW